MVLNCHCTSTSKTRSTASRTPRLAITSTERFERALWVRIERSGLPLPEKQYHWARPYREYRSDFAYPEQRLLLEVQGGIWAQNPGRHNRGSGYERDCERMCLAAALGYRMMYLTEHMIEGGTAINLIQRALNSTSAPTLRAE